MLIFLAVTTTNCIMLHMLLCKDNYSKYSHEANVAMAYHRLDSLKNERKIVIVAGSNGGFSINSHMISDSLELPVVNTSTHAGIGVRMQFEMYKNFLQKDDILVFCPEYYHGINTLYGESTLLRIVSTHIPSAYYKFSVGQWLHTYKYIGIHYQECRNHSNTDAFDGPYSKSSVNEYGDIDCDRYPKEVKDEYHFHGKLDKKTLRYYKYIHEYCDSKGVVILYLPPTLIKKVYDDQILQIDSLVDFMANNEIPFYSNPSRYSFPDSMYYDTPYHMTTDGTVVRTKVLIEDIRKQLNTNP